MFVTGMAVRSGADVENGFNILEGSGDGDLGTALGLAYNGSRSYNGLGEYTCGMGGISNETADGAD